MNMKIQGKMFNIYTSSFAPAAIFMKDESLDLKR